MSKTQGFVTPEEVLGAIYGRTSLECGMSEKRRDEVIAAAIFTSFRNQEFGTHFQLPSDFRKTRHREDAAGIDLVVVNDNGRKKCLQIKGVYIERSIKRRRYHKTGGVARVLGRRTKKMVQRDSEELTQIMKGELKKIIHDYRGLFLIIHVLADLATQTSLEIAINNSRKIVSNLKAKEVWFLRNIPVRIIHGRKSQPNCHAYKLIKVSPDKHTYGFSFAL